MALETQLKTLDVAANVSASHKLAGTNCVVHLTTSENSTVVVKVSADGNTFDTVEDLSFTVNGTVVKPLKDFTPGMFVKFEATAGTLTGVKILG